MQPAWTMSKAGSNRNVIPAQASAQGDMRALRVADFDALIDEVQKRVKNKLLPASEVAVKFEMRRPPLEATEASRKAGAQLKRIYAEELQLQMNVADTASGGGTDAAFAQLKTRAPVIEGMGLSGYGAHSNSAEYVHVASIVPRLYLSVRAVVEAAAGRF